MVKDLQNFQICHFTLGNSRQNEASPLEVLKNCVTSIGISGQEPRPVEIPYNIFWINFQNSTCFLLIPGISTFYFLNNPGTSMSSTLTYLNVFWNRPLKVRININILYIFMYACMYVCIYIYILYIYIAYIQHM